MSECIKCPNDGGLVEIGESEFDEFFTGVLTFVGMFLCVSAFATGVRFVDNSKNRK